MKVKILVLVGLLLGLSFSSLTSAKDVKRSIDLYQVRTTTAEIHLPIEPDWTNDIVQSVKVQLVFKRTLHRGSSAGRNGYRVTATASLEVRSFEHSHDLALNATYRSGKTDLLAGGVNDVSIDSDTGIITINHLELAIRLSDGVHSMFMDDLVIYPIKDSRSETTASSRKIKDKTVGYWANSKVKETERSADVAEGSVVEWEGRFFYRNLVATIMKQEEVTRSRNMPRG